MEEIEPEEEGEGVEKVDYVMKLELWVWHSCLSRRRSWMNLKQLTISSFSSSFIS